ncbi:MAG: DNA translocase FtsK 4TM domain-containing protein [Phycisphaerales bacterium]|nr:DNA translocase FtsK 4TM domain-containing protein [Phycisphaerales bacterium]
MSNPPPNRNPALRFCAVTILSVAMLLAWLSMLSFSAADWPSSSVWPLNSPPRNLCGPIGAWLAHTGFYYLGVGFIPLVVMLSLAFVAWIYRLPMRDLWLRFVGVALIVASASATGAILVDDQAPLLVTGAGGVLGVVAANLLMAQLQFTGSLIILACCAMVGLTLAADEVLARLFRILTSVGRTAPQIARQAGGIASAGASLAAKMANASGRLVTAGAGALAQTAEPPKAARKARAAVEEDEEETDEDDEYEYEYEDEPEDGEEYEDDESEDDEEYDEDEVYDEDEEYEEDDEYEDEADADEEEVEEEDESAPPAKRPAAAGPAVREIGGGAPKAASRDVEIPRDTALSNYQLPSLQLLEEPEEIDKSSIEALCREKAHILATTLAEFRVEVEVVAIETGPVITVFELRLAPGIKVARIASLSNDMARALKAPAVRVVAPLPGKNTIGIEVPNINKEKVRIKDLMRLSFARAPKMAVPLFLGKDAAGQPLVSDLTKMPHMLIAGTTGSGKSVCVASIVMSILLTRTPDEVKLILVDPKVVELALFKDIPHLMCPIVTEMSKAEGILDWATTKMDERYALLAEAGVKDIRSYNALGEAGLRERMEIGAEDDLSGVPVHLPYIVIIIDELADMMMTSAKETEFYLSRLAQKSRAVGIHLIVSTQRPQANVVTGLIKSNLPCRVAFRVASRLDSRIVLDQNGGEVLMGQGDMLFLPPGTHKLVRAQGAFVSDDELRAIVRHARTQGQPQYSQELLRVRAPAHDGGGERDDLFDEAVSIIVESKRGSVSLLQRKLTIGYSRASRLIDQMYTSGIVGEYKGSQAREVLLTSDEWSKLRKARDREEAIEDGRLSYDG